MERLLRWVSNGKVDRTTLWMLRRLFKVFLKKYIGPYILGDLDLEQLEFHLCSGAHLNDVVLNVDAINTKLSEYPFALKEGSVGRVTVKLSPQLNIELDGLELRFVPRTDTNGAQTHAPSSSSSEAQQLESETDHGDSVGMEGCSYSSVRAGVRVVADLFERLFFGARVVLNQVYIAIEEMPRLRPSEASKPTFDCMLLCRIGCAQYCASQSIGIGEERQGEDLSSLTSNISFQRLCLEVVGVDCDDGEDPSSREGSSKGHMQPISLMQDDAGLSGHATISINANSGCSYMPKVEVDINLEHIRLHFTAQQIQQLLNVVSSYLATDICKMETAQGVDSNTQSSNELFMGRYIDGILDCKEATPSKSVKLGSRGSYSRCTLLSDANYFADWVHANDHENGFKESVTLDEDLAASTEEFFDCLSGSELLTLPCEAISLASSLLFGSVLPSQGRQVTHVIKVKIAGFSVLLKEDLLGEHILGATVLDINLSGQVCQRQLEWQLLLKHVEAYQLCHQNQRLDLMEELDYETSKTVHASAQPLQALVEQSVPKFPVSISEGSQTARASSAPRKCFFKLSKQGHHAGLQVDAKHKLSSSLGGQRSHKRQDCTEYNFHFQPLAFWVDASILRNLLNWVESFICSASGGKKASSSDTSLAPPISRTLNFNMFFSSIRFWICSPYSSGSTTIWKDHVICLDLLCPIKKFSGPTVKLRFPDAVDDKLSSGSAILAFKESHLYLVSPLMQSEGSETRSVLEFRANKVLSISLCSSELATVQIFLKSKSGGGMSLAERVWTGIAEQQRGGMGSESTSTEFAAAMATEVMDKNNQKLREDISLTSSIGILVTVPKVKVELYASEDTIVIEVLTSLVAAITSNQRLNGGCLVDQKDSNQVFVSLDIGEAEIVLRLNFVCSSSLKMKTSTPWENYTIIIHNLQMLHVVNLGMVNDASYFWLHHGNGCIKGLLADISPDELQLLTIRDDALGRGDGGGGNALATKSAGIEVSVMSWPGGGHTEKMLISIVVRGSTFMAHGGHLDWLPGLVTFFSQHDETCNSYAIYEDSCFSTTERRIVRLAAGVSRAGEETSLSTKDVLFTLDLHDAALCYEPGKEAVSAALLKANNTKEQFDPVACVLAAAAVRVSSNAPSNAASKNYRIRLRDVALLLADATLRRRNVLDFTVESLHRDGYVKVAGEAVMGAVFRINGGDGLVWEVECLDNQLRLDTCHDTTAALSRLIAQLQQLFAPEMEHCIANQSAKLDMDSSAHQSYHDGTESDSSDLNNTNSKNATRLEGFLEDACLLAGGVSVHSCCNCLDVLAIMDDKFVMHSKSPQLTDDVTQESHYNSLDQWSQGGGEEDLQTPVPHSEEAPTFIEDYYGSRTSSLQSSIQSSCTPVKDAAVQTSQVLSDDFDKQSKVDSNGGWYDGESFKFVENHVPTQHDGSGLKKHRGDLPHSSKRRLGLSSCYPKSVGRVIFQDLKLRWRLYGGSDWPISKRKDAEVNSARHSVMCMEVIFHGVNLRHDMFPKMGSYASKLALNILDVGVYDCSKDAPWKKVLGYHRSKSRAQESSAKILKLELESVRPDPSTPVEEYRLSVQLLPLLLHLDQRHVDFLANFFAAPPPSSQGFDEVASSYSSFEMKVSEESEDVLLPFFQTCELHSFSIRVDYVPRHVDIGALSSGNYAELANLVSWKGIELELKHVRVTGVRGWETLSSIVVGEWLEDVSHNQIHKLLRGLGPIRPLYAVGSGAAKLVVLPAEQYKKDRRRLLQGIRKGTTAFLRSISLEAVGLGVQLAAGAHEILIQTESALGSVGLLSSLEKVEVRPKAGQPGDMREGLLQAYESLSQGLERTASSLIGNPLKAYHKAGTSVAVASALRAAPSAAVAPAVAAAGALHRALLGVRNSLDPERRKESEEKHSEPPSE